jgi:2-polyprenyl-3-methyl-5-hydroxy-6-metoxy-1,4-benzoquinol methylase
MTEVEASFRTGAGFAFATGGDETRISEGEGNRPAYLHQLGQQWLPAIPEVHARLQAAPPARIADVGCGLGWSSIGMALAYHAVHVDGVDLDEPSIEMARRNAESAGVADRVAFIAANAADPGLEGRYDLITVLEAFHDMSHPIQILAMLRDVLADGGSILIADMKVDEQFRAPGSDFERYVYGWSVFGCLHGSLEGGGVGTGTAMRPATLRGYAADAGLTVEIVPIEHDSWRFYRLVPATN